MANHRAVADWFSLSFEHSADVFCCHDGTQTAPPIPRITLNETVPAHPPTDKAIPPGND